jgi:hypothetical protein
LAVIVSRAYIQALRSTRGLQQAFAHRLSGESPLTDFSESYARVLRQIAAESTAATSTATPWSRLPTTTSSAASATLAAALPSVAPAPPVLAMAPEVSVIGGGNGSAGDFNWFDFADGFASVQPVADVGRFGADTSFDWSALLGGMTF